MTLGRWVLGACAVLFGGFGLVFLFAPAEGIAAAGLLPQTPTAMTELRSYYGAFQIGFALFLALCARRREWTSAGLALLTLTAGALAGGRCLGLVLESGPQPLTWQLLSIEATIAAIATFAWWREAN